MVCICFGAGDHLESEAFIFDQRVGATGGDVGIEEGLAESDGLMCGRGAKQE